MGIRKSMEDIAGKALADFTFPCCALSAKTKNGELYRVFAGRSVPEDARPLDKNALFDIASLTKPLATTLLTLKAMERGEVTLCDEARRYFPFSNIVANGATIEDLLCHRSGLPAIPALHLHFDSAAPVDREAAIFQLMRIEPERAPGVRVEYSCTGFLLLGMILEKIGGQRLSVLFEKEIAGPLGLTARSTVKADGGRALFSPVGADRELCVPTEICPWRGRRIRGEVHDESSYCLGGDGGNAGLFANLAAVETLFGVYEHGGGLLSEDTVANARLSRTDGMEQRRGLGLLLGGAEWGQAAYGHTGFTGTSAWRDPERNIAGIALTNRVYYGREATLEKILAFRNRFYARIADSA